MGTPLRVLIVEDSEDDAILVLRELRRADYDLTSERVDTPQAMNAALDQQTWDIVLSDYAMPRFSMPAALAMVKEKGLDLPFIIVSGAIGEEAAVAAMRAGAHDYVMKNDLTRLAPAVERELREAEVRREREQMEKALQESEDKFKRFVEEMNDGYCVLQGSRIVFANARSAEMFGYAPDEVIGRTIQELLPSEIVRKLVRVHARRQRGETVPRQYATTLTRKDQTTCSVEFGARLIEYRGKQATSVVIRDITERKRAEEALREEEQRFRTLIENSSDAIAILNDDGVIRYESPSVERVLGYKPQELVSKDMLEFIHPDDVENVVKTFMTIVSNPGQALSMELRFLHKDGSWRVLEGVGNNLLNDPKVNGIIANYRDITERKQAEEALRESAEKYRLLFEASEAGINLLDKYGNFLMLNKPAAKIWGMSIEDMVSKNLRDIMPPDMANEAMSLIHEIEETRTGRRQERYIKPLDKYFIEEIQPVLDSDGKFFGVQVLTYDITERKRAEEALRESEEWLRALFETITDGIIVTDMAGRIIQANQAAVRMVGYSNREEIIGRDAFEFVLPKDRAQARDDTTRTLEEGRTQERTEYTVLAPDGKQIDVDASAAVLHDSCGTPVGIVNVVRDISERKRMEQQLHLAGRLASVGELAAGVAHELNNPLTAVQAFAQLLNDRDDLDQTIRSDVETIYREAQRATRITTNLLSFARRHIPEKHLISINEVIEKTLELNAYRMRVNNIDLVTDLDPDLPTTMADFHQMQQVFVNIINNAEQAMIEAHGRGKLCIKTQKAGKMIQIAFTDDGPGIPEDSLKKLFDPFFTTKEVGRGTGLGLSICYGLVQEHGGHISARSKPGEGATFVVEIPILSEGERTAQAANSVRVEET